MDPFAPLLQTLAWIALIVWTVLRFSRELKAIVGAIEARIKDGSSIKAGPVEIGSLVRPQSTAEQSEQIQLELEDYSSGIESDGSEGRSDSHESSSGEDIDLFNKSRPIIAEDLVLRMLQEEYGTLISRKVSGGKNLRFDGFFVAGEAPHAVEVKYSSGYLPVEQLVEAVRNIHDQAKALNWRRFSLILVLVLDHNFPPDPDRIDLLRRRIHALNSNTVLRTFPFSEVVGHFGIDMFESEEG